MNEGFTLTAVANRDVGPTPYYIQIYQGGRRWVSCGSGTTCRVTLRSAGPGNFTFQARIARSDGSDAQAWSSTVTVRVTSTTGGIVLSVPYLSQIYPDNNTRLFGADGSFKGYMTTGLNNCGPAAVAMVIQYYGGTATVDSAARVIRSSSAPGRGNSDIVRIGADGVRRSENRTTSFMEASAINLLGSDGLHAHRIGARDYDSIRRHLDAQHPVLMLVDNRKYITTSNKPYSTGFAGAHIVVVTGYDQSNFYINDPLAYPDRGGGRNFPVPVANFAQAADSSYGWLAAAVSRN